jgi:hypothetical protein
VRALIKKTKLDLINDSDLKDNQNISIILTSNYKEVAEDMIDIERMHKRINKLFE